MPNTLYDALFKPHLHNEAIFLYLPDNTQISYRQFLELAGQMANTLVAHGVQPGDRIAVQVGKSPQALALYAASVMAGAVFLPLNTAYTSGELGYFITDAEPRILVCDKSRVEELTPLAEDTGVGIVTLNADGSGTLCTAAAEQPASFAVVDRVTDDLAALLYTSGTTGRSKGAMLSHDNLLSNASTLARLWDFTRADVLLHALPIFHTHGLFVATNVILARGASMQFLNSFDLDTMIRLLPRSSTMMGVPTFYTRLLDDPRLNRQLVQNMRLFISGSAPLLADTHVAFEQRTGHRILERYGMTETNMNTSNPYDGERRAGTVGFPLPGVELRVCEPGSETVLPTGKVGVVEVRGPNVFRGYWKQPDKTRQELRDNGFFITGDLGLIDSDGYLQIVGRGKDLIISGGYNIYPKEVELVLDEQPGVLESAVIGVPHADFGEGVVAVLVAEPGVTLDPGVIAEAIRDRIARFKQPRSWQIVSELPRNTMGKVQKNLLRETCKHVFDT